MLARIFQHITAKIERTVFVIDNYDYVTYITQYNNRKSARKESCLTGYVRGAIFWS